MKRYALILSTVAIALSALAPSSPTYATGNHTCEYGGKYPHCNTAPKPPTPTSNVDINPLQNQSQYQGQNQGQHQTANGGSGGHSTSVATGTGGTGYGGQGGAGGRSDSTSGAASNATGGSATGGSVGTVSSGSNAVAQGGYSGGNNLSNGSNSRSAATTGASTANGVVDVSDHSRTNINTFIPGDLPANAMTIAPGAYITTASDQSCGMLQQKIEVPVYQWNKRGTKKVQVGVDHELAPVYVNGVQQVYQIVPKANGGYYELGSYVTYVLSTKGSSTSSQLGAQGYGAGGGGGISFGSGRSYSEPGTHVIIRSCVRGDYNPKPIVAAKSKTQIRRVIIKKKPHVRPRASCKAVQMVCPK